MKCKGIDTFLFCSRIVYPDDPPSGNHRNFKTIEKLFSYDEIIFLNEMDIGIKISVYRANGFVSSLVLTCTECQLLSRRSSSQLMSSTF